MTDKRAGPRPMCLTAPGVFRKPAAGMVRRNRAWRTRA